MPAAPRASTSNRLLEALPGKDLRRVLSLCDTVDLVFADVIYAPWQQLGFVYFPTQSFISLIMPVDASSSLEVGLIGNEGMFGVPLVLGIDVSPVRAVVQGAGAALRMPTAVFGGELARSHSLRRGLERYAFVQMTQLAQAAACTRFHVVEARLARWLLMTQDRAHSDNFHVTQEFLALMLGVRRVGVTEAASSLQRLSLIRYSRGNIDVLDRRGLEAAACGCYKADIDSYNRILSTPRPSKSRFDARRQPTSRRTERTSAASEKARNARA